MADIARGVLAGVSLAPGEGLAVINSSAFGTGLAALALADAARLVDAADVAGALALEGFAANVAVLDPAIAGVRPDPALIRTLARFHDLLAGSFVWQEGAARNLQDPLTFRSTAAIQAVARVALQHAPGAPRPRAQRRPGQPGRARPRTAGSCPRPSTRSWALPRRWTTSVSSSRRPSVPPASAP